MTKQQKIAIVVALLTLIVIYVVTFLRNGTSW
jgi:hypothetical protein